jgi:hypothetical protein
MTSGTQRNPRPPTTTPDPWGPVSRYLFTKIWRALFNPNSTFYLPQVMLQGGSQFPPVDPYTYSGSVGRQCLHERWNSACDRPNINAVLATADAWLTLSNLTITGLHAVEPFGDLTFDADDQGQPRLTGIVNFGTLSNVPIPLEVAGAFLFEQACCVPLPNSTQCSDQQWTSSGNGTFHATAAVGAAQGSLTLTVGDQISISVDSLQYVANPASALGQQPPPPPQIRIYIDTLSDPALEQAMASAAASNPIAKQQVVNNLNAALNDRSQPGSVPANIEAIINAQLAAL